MPTPTFHAHKFHYLLIHPSTFTENISVELHLMPPSFIALCLLDSLPPLPTSAQCVYICRRFRAPLVLFPRDGLQGWGCRNGPQLGSNPGTARLQSGTLSIEHTCNHFAVCVLHTTPLYLQPPSFLHHTCNPIAVSVLYLQPSSCCIIIILCYT